MIRLVCPGCRQIMWVDPESGDIVKTEKPKKEKNSLDTLLTQEKNKQLASDQRFATTAKLRDMKQAEARKRFAKILSDVEADKSKT